jgi:hypothetical protein
MSGKSSPKRSANTDEALKRIFGIKPGPGQITPDPEARPETETCGICGGQHATHSVKGGD